MITNSQPGDTCLFVYSGHGGDKSWFGESRQFLCCIGGNDREYLWDSELHGVLNSAQPGVKILVLLDCCHAGYMAGLPYRFKSTARPKPMGRGSASQRWLARYNNWRSNAQWSWSKYHFPHRKHSKNRDRQVITANQAQAKPFIICITASEYYESSWGGVGPDQVALFLIRAMAYIFGDDRKNSRHEYHNAYKSIGQQYYMTLDSNFLQEVGGEGQHAVMTSNCMFDVDSFTLWDFFTKQFYQNYNGHYYLYESSWMRWCPWNWW